MAENGTGQGKSDGGYQGRFMYMGMAYMVLETDGVRSIHINRNIGDMSILSDIGDRDPAEVLSEWYKTASKAVTGKETR